MTQLELTLDCRQRRGELLARGTLSDEQERFVCRRSTLFQLPELFCHGWRSAEYPLQYVITNGKRHPLRPPKPVGVVYSRYLTELGETISFRALTRDDLCLVHRWMNEPRIAQIWELAGTRDELAAYLDEVRRDPHTLPLIGCFDDQPFGYFEVYWAKEDRVAPFYPADDYDRGMHVLSGEPRFRGPARVAAWLRSLSHYLFLDEPRTRNLVAEPRIENAKMIQYFSQCGFYKQRRFEFPHKRAAMMIVARDAFFDEHCP